MPTPFRHARGCVVRYFGASDPLTTDVFDPDAMTRTWNVDLHQENVEVMDDLKYWVAFHRINGIGPKRFNRMESYFGSLENAWGAKRGELRDAGISHAVAEDIDSKRDRIDPDTEMERLLRRGIRPMHLRSDEYPEQLAESPDAPAVIYVGGDLEPCDTNSVSIVGTRNATEYGVQMATLLASELVRFGITIVSGLAIGIDSAAHRSALKAGGRTIAVLAGGLDAIYPQRNRGLAREIVESGCLISEYQLGVNSKREHFPRRNRIISGLSRGVIVVEAAKKSGATWTVKWALEQNREVFAVPGNATSLQSEGTNWLIQQGAKLTTCADDVLQELSAFFGDLERDPETDRRKSASKISATVTGRNGSSKVKAAQTRKPRLEEIETFNEQEHAIVKALWDADRPAHVDEVARALSSSVTDVMSTLTMMEVRGVVRCTEGALYDLSNRRAELSTPRLLDEGQPA